MLCCLESPFTNSRDSDAYQRQTSDGFPGSRRFVKTGGNALAAAAPLGPPQDGASMVSVTVPEGVSGGQNIQVLAADGSGRTVMATVPQTMGPGSHFMVQFPPVPRQSAPAPSAPIVAAEPDYAGLVPVLPPPSNHSPVKPVVPALPAHSSFSAATVPTASPVPAYSSSPVVAPVAHTPVAQQCMMRVLVPPGSAPGTTVHVQIPGENRVMAVQVPPNVAEFYVTYEPRGDTAPVVSPSPAITAPSITPIPPPVGQSRRVLVKVPPGTAPGTTLHVKIPDEPGRVIAAQVPSGNVSEFYVSYLPCGGPTAQTESSPNNPIRSTQRTFHENNRGGSGSNGAGMGSVFLPLLGGAALGAAGMSLFDRRREASDAYNTGDAYATESGAGDYGGGDYAENGGGAYAGQGGDCATPDYGDGGTGGYGDVRGGDYTDGFGDVGGFDF